MIAELNGETRAVLRHRRGVMWCPFCDRSRQDDGLEQRCDGCFAVFTDEAAEAAPEATPRRRRATAQEGAEEAEEEAEAEVAE
jgi:hypothetical protein